MLVVGDSFWLVEYICVCVCACVCAHACVCACVCTGEWYLSERKIRHAIAMF